MREIKFRVWSESEHKYIDGLTRYLFGYDDDEKCTLCVPQDLNAIFEQYAGLKDKNGKEIYEGDIVVNTYYDDGEMYKVLWVDDSVAFGMESLDDMELYKLPLESLEVIGNIHENAELLG